MTNRSSFIRTMIDCGFEEKLEDGAYLLVAGKMEIVVTDNDQVIIFNGLKKIGTYDTFDAALKVLNLG